MTDPVQSITALARELREVKDEIDGLEERIKILNARKDKIEAEDLPRLMEDSEIPKLTITGVGTLYLDRRVRVSVLSEDKPAFLDWLKTHGHAAIIKEDVPWNTLSAWGKELLEENQALPEMCKVNQLPVARIRRK